MSLLLYIVKLIKLATSEQGMLEEIQKTGNMTKVECGNIKEICQFVHVIINLCSKKENGMDKNCKIHYVPCPICIKYKIQ